MHLKKPTAFFLILAIAAGACSGWTFAATAGSSDDPLITKSYLISTYTDSIMSEPRQLLEESFEVLQYKLSQVNTSDTSIKKYYDIESGGSITLGSGSGFLLMRGGGALASCTGVFLDLSTGAAVSAGSSLPACHQYLAAENTTAVVNITEDSAVSVFGEAEVIGTNLPTFTDISETNWYYDDVCTAYKKGLINGRSATIFDPESNLSIAEAIKLAACMNQLYNDKKVTLENGSPYWYSSYVQYALDKGIITGAYSNYDTKITRSEFVAIFYRALPESEYTAVNTVSDNAIPDVKTSDNNASSIYSFYRAGILNGSTDDGRFLPANNIRRSEVAAIMTRMFEKSKRVSITLS